MTAFKSISVGRTPCAGRDPRRGGVGRYIEGAKGPSPSRGGGIQRYLEHGDRALAMDFVNLSADEEGRWAEVFDETRLRVGRRQYKVSNPRLWMHFCISPDPRDDVSLAQLRDLATAFCRRFFGDYQCAVAYHDDNEGNIPHAHIVVNNVHLRTGRKAHLDERTNRAMEQWVQDESRKRGLSWFRHREGDWEERIEERAEERKAARRREAQTRADAIKRDQPWAVVDVDRIESRLELPPDEEPTAYLPKPVSVPGRQAEAASHREDFDASKWDAVVKPEFSTTTERRLRERGERPWKDAVREAVRAAAVLSDGTTASFVAELSKLGVEYSASSKVFDNVAHYRISADASPDGQPHDVSSDRLGHDYSRSGVASQVYNHGRLPRACAGAAGSHAGAMAGPVTLIVDRTGLSNAEIREIRRACGMTLPEMTAMLTVIADEGLRSTGGMRRKADALDAGTYAAKSSPEARAARAEALREAAAFADAHGILPQAAPRRKTRIHDDDGKKNRKAVPLPVKVAKGMRLSKREWDYVHSDGDVYLKWRNARNDNESRGNAEANVNKRKRSSSGGSAGASRSAPSRSQMQNSKGRT